MSKVIPHLDVHNSNPQNYIHRQTMVLKQNKQLQNCQAHTWKGAELVMGEGKGSELLEVAQH